MILLPIVRDLIERNALRKKVIGPTDDKRWLTGLPPGLNAREILVGHGCVTHKTIVVETTLTLTQFLMDMKPQVGVLVYVGQCEHCKVAFFGEHDDADAEQADPPAGPPKKRNPKGKDRR